MNLKTCDRCGKQYEPRAANQRWCVECRTIGRKEQKSAEFAKWCLANLEYFKEYHKVYYPKHRAKLCAYACKWEKEHPDKSVEHQEKNCIRHRKYYVENRDGVLAKGKEYRHTPVGMEVDRRSARKHSHEVRTSGKLDVAAFYAKCAEFGWHCRICGRELTKDTVTIDHIIPVSMGGTNAIENLQPLCRSCNCRKRTRPMKEMVGSEFLFQ
jgi:5-methylcytosine-specific restriction endonuclease McrA